MGTVVLLAILGGTTWAIWVLARKDTDLKIRVCRGHGGDGIETCPECLEIYCRECQPDGHCDPAYRGSSSWTENS